MFLDRNKQRPVAAAKAPSRAVRFRPRLEALEDRVVPSITTLSFNPATLTLTAIVTKSGSDTLQPGNGSPQPGFVRFRDGSTDLAFVRVSRQPDGITGRASLFVGELGAGIHSFNARYDGEISLGVFPEPDCFPSVSNTLTEVFQTPLPPPAPLGTDVTSQVFMTERIFAGGTRGVVTVQNVGGLTIGGPLDLVLVGLPRHVHLRHSSVATAGPVPVGSPFVVEDVTLPPDGSAKFLLLFRNPAHKHIRFTPELFAASNTGIG
jgi:hypothetical protein